MDTLATLADQTCQPLHGDAHRLPEDEVKRLLGLLPDWQIDTGGGAIHKTFRFSDYYRTIAFVNAIAYGAHRDDHHPDLSVHYDHCVVRYSTHDVGGLSMNDFVCAAKAERLCPGA